ncbi:MAG: hypothetical protein QT00_C0001G0484 [archaeon GW2011_AR5]|nr:MAG: hypothetical protein QT00_C0001G0484 [archaeon GW2011_AR5]
MDADGLKANPVIIEDWILADTDEVLDAIVQASGRRRIPVALVFEKPEDFIEYKRPDDFSPYIIDGETYLRMPSRYSDATFVEARLADMGYKPAGVFYGKAMPHGKDCVLFTFVPEKPDKK